MRLLTVLNMDPDWANSEKGLQQIHDLAEPLFTKRPPLPEKEMAWNSFKRSDFFFLLSLGYGTKDVMKMYNVGQVRFFKWKDDQGLSGKSNDQLLYIYSDGVSIKS